VAYASERHVLTCFRSVLISDEEFKKYQMFQQFQAVLITPSSFIVTLAQSGNPTVYFTSKAPNTWIINNGVFNHITRNKGILHDLCSPLSLSTVILTNGIMSRVDSVGTAEVTTLFLSSVFYIPKFSFDLLSITILELFGDVFS